MKTPDELKKPEKKIPGFFTPYERLSEPAGEIVGSVAVIPALGAGLALSGALGTAVSGTATVAGVATIGMTSNYLGQPTSVYAQRTAGSVALMVIGLLTMGVSPPLGVLRLVTRTVATATAAAVSSSVTPTVTPQQSAPENTAVEFVTLKTPSADPLVTETNVITLSEIEEPHDEEVVRLSPRR